MDNIVNNDKYVIINNGEPIHADLCGRFVHGSKAAAAFKRGYSICPVCDALYLHTRGEITSQKEHVNTAVHKNFIKPYKQKSKRFN